MPNARENVYQRRLIQRLEAEFPGCVILKNDPTRLQGVPDLLILFGTHWAMLETKRVDRADIQPNQEFYIKTLGAMSYAAFVYPENEEDVIDDLQQALRSRG